MISSLVILVLHCFRFRQYFLWLNGRWIPIPYFGFLPFLLWCALLSPASQSCVNTLLRVPSISTINTFHRKIAVQFCVNTLLRVPSISTRLNRLNRLNPKRNVSIPYFGFLPFLHNVVITCKITDMCVSIPYFGFLPFLRKMKEGPSLQRFLCQYPTSGSFHFYRFYSYLRISGC